MKKLTEEMVIARAKISDMSKIKRLNCWGSELADVTLLRQMPNVEVLSLSINKINNLADFEHCRSLQELYVRQNEIRELNQVCYLQNLSNLKHLWLGENPCANTDGYRLAVIRALPQLQKLDNIVIQPDELSDAMKNGRILCHPHDQQDQDEEYEPPQPRYPQSNYRNGHQPGEYPSETYYQSPDRSPPRQETEYDPEDRDPGEFYEEEDRRGYESPPRQDPMDTALKNIKWLDGLNDEKLSTKSLPESSKGASLLNKSPPRRQSDQRRSFSPEQEPAPVYYDDRRNANNYDQDSPRHQQYYDRSPTKEYIEESRITPDSPRETKFIPNSQSNNSVKEYTNGDRHHYQSSQYRQHEGSDGSNHSHSGGYEQSRRERCEKNSCPANHRPPFNRRPVTRNSNILSAVLCLVKELDYPSLEVVEMAVRCRMDELEE